MYPKYPYTDFHRLNADWILEKTKECVEKVDNLESDADALQERMTTAEGNIGNLQGRMNTAEGSIGNLQQGLGIAEQNIETNTDWLQNHETRVRTLEGQMAGALESLDHVESDIEWAIQAINQLTKTEVHYTITGEAGVFECECNKSFAQVINAIQNKKFVPIITYGTLTAYNPNFSTYVNNTTIEDIIIAFTAVDGELDNPSGYYTIYIRQTSSGIYVSYTEV